MTSPKVWFITGASTGFGRELTEHVLHKGDVAVATARRPAMLDELRARYPASRLLVLKLDVSVPQEITDAFAQVKATLGRLDVVVNNAGWGALGEVEAVRDEDARSMFEANFWGAANVTREAVKFFREVNAPGIGGRLLQVTSMAGFSGGPSWGYYAASKHALEGLSECLAAEVDPAWNVKITIIEPGGFRTQGINKVLWAPEHPAYGNPDLPTTRIRKAWDTILLDGDPKKAVEAIYKIAELPEPPLRVPLGKDSVGLVRKKLASVAADVDQYEYLSEDLTVDE